MNHPYYSTTRRHIYAEKIIHYYSDDSNRKKTINWKFRLPIEEQRVFLPKTNNWWERNSSRLRSHFNSLLTMVLFTQGKNNLNWEWCNPPTYLRNNNLLFLTVRNLPNQSGSDRSMWMKEQKLNNLIFFIIKFSKIDKKSNRMDDFYAEKTVVPNKSFIVLHWHRVMLIQLCYSLSFHDRWQDKFQPRNPDLLAYLVALQ